MKAYSIPALIIASICFTFALSDSFAWVLRQKKKSDFAFILICLSGVAFNLFCAGEYGIDDPVRSVFWLKGQVISSTLAGFALFWFVAEVTGLIKARYVVACLVWAVLSFLSQLFDLGDLTWVVSRPFTLRIALPFGLDFVYREVERGIVLVAIAAVGFCALLYLLFVVIAYSRRGNRTEARVLLCSLGFILAAQILDFLIGIGVIRFVFLLEYAWLATILVIGLRRSNDYVEAALTRKELQKTDQALKDWKATLSTLMDSTADMIWSVDADDFRLLTFNRSFQLYFSRYRGVSAAVGMGQEDLFSSAEEMAEWKGLYRRAIDEGSYSIERAMGESGRVFRLSVNRLGRGDRTFGLSVFAQDITERKKAEERIARSLSEKEVLLREVYHRTKNNMSVIISMLKLQANAIGDPRLREAYAVSIDRIRSMSLAHDSLYMTGDLSQIDLKRYIEDLANRLVKNRGPGETQPTLALEMDSARVALDTAINCGLIVNELITNALKYAFPGDRNGEIKITLRKAEAGRLRLTVADDGVGLASGFDMERDGHLGLKIITKLAHGKLRAQVEFKTEQGFACSLVFPGGGA